MGAGDFLFFAANTWRGRAQDWGMADVRHAVKFAAWDVAGSLDVEVGRSA